MSLLLKYADPSLLVSVVRRVTEPVVTRWPATMFARFAGSLAYRDQQGQQTATGTGPIRYQPAPGTRINLIKNPRFAVDASSWADTSGGNVTHVQDDPVLGGNALEIISSVASGGGATFPQQGQIGVHTPGPYTISFDAYLVSGASDWRVVVEERDAINSATVGSGVAGDITVTAQRQRFRVTYTPTAWASGTYDLRPRIVRASSTPGTIRITNVVMEYGDIANPTYFDPSVTPNAAWLDPITGQLGTPHQSPSVEQPVIWVEEGTTNLVTNPWFAVNTTGWSAANGSIARTTSYRLQGPGAGLLTASGANATATTAITASAATHTAQWIVRNLATASRTVQLRYNGANIGSAVTLASGEQKTLTAQFTGTGASANLELVVTNSANGNQIVIYYAGAEQKAYATSPCPFIDSSGNLLPGYSWSGTAHASTSTRSNAFVSAPNAGHLDSSINGAFSVVLWYTKRVTPAAGMNVWRANGGANETFGPALRALADGSMAIAPRGDGSGQVVTPVAVPVNEEHCYGMTWDGTTWRAYYDGALIGASTGVAPSLGLDAAMEWLNQGMFRSHLIYRRVLTDAEMAALANLGPRRVDYDTLRMP